MKNIHILLIIIFSINVSIAQKGSREKVKALKIAYISEQVDLSSKEAEQFWPIYNSYEETMSSLKKQERASSRGLKTSGKGVAGATEKEAEVFLNNYISAEEKKCATRKKLVMDLKKVISHKKILLLVDAERDFNRRLLRKLRDQRKAN